MTYTINETHDPNLKSWVESANDPNTDFPIQNLPFGLFARLDLGSDPRVGVAIGDQVLDLTECCKAKLLSIDYGVWCSLFWKQLDISFLNTFPLRALLVEWLKEGNTTLRDFEKSQSNGLSLLVPMSHTEMYMPVRIGDYTDFYASVYHATNIGKMFRPDQPLMPNYKWIPIGYHGRASSIVVSG